MSSKLDQSAFNCPHCDAYAQQVQYNCFAKDRNSEDSEFISLKDPLKVDKPPRVVSSSWLGTECLACGCLSLWMDNQLIYPKFPENIPKPNVGLPDDIKDIYREAANIADDSPRSAAAMLRLCLEKILIHLKIKGKNLNEQIAHSNFPEKILNACDSVRVHGNSAVHAGKIELNDNYEIVNTLFLLINYIAEQQITLPKKVDEIYDTLSEQQKLQIKNRKSEKNGK